jgi:hypothetical protein
MDLDQGSDHFPIETSISLEASYAPVKKNRKWKDLDSDAVSAGAKGLRRPPAGISLVDEIETYTAYLLGFTQELVEHTIQWAKPSPKANPWWTPEIQRLVKEERRLRRCWVTTSDERARIERLEKSQEKKKLISYEKRKAFRQDIHDAAESSEGVWRLAKWARTKGLADKGPELPTMPPLEYSEGTASTFEDKVLALSQRFYPDSPADLSDIADYSFRDETFQTSLPLKQEITTDEIEGIIRRQASKKAPGRDGIPMEFLKAMGRPLAEAVAGLAEGCWRAGYYPERFREAQTVVLKKPGKGAYNTAGAWRPIALLNTIGKLIETAMARRLQELAETHRLLPGEQMGARKGRSVDTALELLIEQVYTV